MPYGYLRIHSSSSRRRRGSFTSLNLLIFHGKKRTAGKQPSARKKGLYEVREEGQSRVEINRFKGGSNKQVALHKRIPFSPSCISNVHLADPWIFSALSPQIKGSTLLPALNILYRVVKLFLVVLKRGMSDGENESPTFESDTTYRPLRLAFGSEIKYTQLDTRSGLCRCTMERYLDSL